MFTVIIMLCKLADPFMCITLTAPKRETFFAKYEQCISAAGDISRLFDVVSKSSGTSVKYTCVNWGLPT